MVTLNRGIVVISIHAPREGSDEKRAAQLQEKSAISIHAPREGSDPVTHDAGVQRQGHFYPRSP